MIAIPAPPDHDERNQNEHRRALMIRFLALKARVQALEESS